MRTNRVWHAPIFCIIPTHKIAYLVMRKCGCSSIKQAMSAIRDQTPAASAAEIHGSRKFLVRADDLHPTENWFTFTVTRDPIARFLSFYANKILDQNLSGNHTFVHHRRFGFLPNMTMDKAIDVVLDPSFEAEPHLVSQSRLIESAGFELDYVGMLEDFQNFLMEIERQTGIMLPVQHLNQGKQKPLIPSASQFERLADHYRNDLICFNYPDNFEDWCKINTENSKEKFQSEEGFEFDGEAKLLRHRVTRQKNRFLIELYWRVEPTQSFHRVIRIVKRTVDNVREKIWHLPPNTHLKQAGDSRGFVHETIPIPFAAIPNGIDPDDLYFELYFSQENGTRPILTNYSNHQNMLIFALKEVGQHSQLAK